MLEIKTVRKIKIIVVGEDVNSSYNFLRKETIEQNKALNFSINHLIFTYCATEKIKLLDEVYSEKVKEKQTLIDNDYKKISKAKKPETKKKYEENLSKHQKSLQKIRKDKTKEAKEILEKALGRNIQNSIRDLVTDKFALYSDTKDRLIKTANTDFYNDLSEVLQGLRTFRNYKKDNPLLIRGRVLKFYKNEKNYFISFIKGITFKCILATKRQNSIELEHTINKIIDNKIKVCDSSIQIQKKDLILNLVIESEEENIKNLKKEGRIVGVDLGLKIPAYVSLNDDPIIKKGIGSIDDFLRVRSQMQKRRRNLQQNLRTVQDSKGRKKKTKALEQIKRKEKNFATTYNHMLSKSIITFAVKNKAEQINLELIRMGKTENHRILANWSYFQLQKMIEYKAEKLNIEVKYVDPYHTSQTCSFCGHYEEGQRPKQAKFICKNKTCSNFEKAINADYNASQNIAKSKKYITHISESEYHSKNKNDTKFDT